MVLPEESKKQLGGDGGTRRRPRLHWSASFFKRDMLTVRWTIPLIVVLAHTLSCRAPGPGRSADHIPESTGDRTRVVLLGTGTPNAEPDRSGPAIAIVVGEQAYLVDCGPGVVRRAAAAAQNGIQALAFPRLTRLFITHLHSDHTAGYADLILTPWVLERKDPLLVFGPKGTQAMTDHLLAAYDADIHMRLDGLEPANGTGFRVRVVEIEPGIIYADENVTVEAFSVDHGNWDQSFGYRFNAPDRSIVVSGDTRPSDNLVRHARGCDVLIHEVYSHAGFQRKPHIWRRYHAAFHTSTLELGRIAERVQPGLLILTHQLFWGATESDLLREIGQVYDGAVVSGNDLDVY